MWTPILFLFLLGAQLSLGGGGGVHSPPLIALQEENIAQESSPAAAAAPPLMSSPRPPKLVPDVFPAALPPAPVAPVNIPLVPIAPVQPLPPVPIPDTAKFDLILTEHNVDFAALYSIIRNNVDILREEVFLRLYCSKGVCKYPITPLVMSQATKYYVTARKNYSILVTITLAPREPLQDRVIYQVDLDNIIVSQLKRQYTRLEVYLQCFKRVCLVPSQPFTGTEVNAYCNYQDLTEACMFVTSTVIMNFESDFDNSLKINKGEAGNVAITTLLR